MPTTTEPTSEVPTVPTTTEPTTEVPTVHDDDLDYAPRPTAHEAVFGRPPIALPDKEQQHEHQRHHQDVADHAGPLRTSHHL